MNRPGTRTRSARKNDRTVDFDTGSQYSLKEREQKYDWSEKKAATNWRDHGVTFKQAVKALKDHFFVERFDAREDYGEERINLLGMCDGVLLHVTYTERDEVIWIISARRAEKHEQDRYYRENTTGRHSS